MALHVRLSSFRIPKQNMLNCVHDCKVAVHFSDDDLREKVLVLYLDKYGIIKMEEL